MDLSLQFGQVVEYIPYLLGGAWLSLQIAFLAFMGGMVIGLLCATAKTFGRGFWVRPIDAYVTFITNTPQLVQIYFIFFALPEAGIVLSPYQALLLGMTINAGGYLTQIQRGGFLSVHRNELEAAYTVGFSLMQTVRYVILPHIAKVLFPPLSNQYILMTLGTSMGAIVGVEELTGRAFNVEAETFRSIEIFTIAAVIYVAITIIATAILVAIGRTCFRARMKVF